MERRHSPNPKGRAGKGLPRSTPQYQSHDRRSPRYRCGGKHDASKCRFKEYECHYCKKRGHLASVCRKKAKDAKSPEQAQSGSSR